MLAYWMFPALILGIFAGFPVAFSMMAVALVFGLIQFGDVAVFQYVSKVNDIASANVFAAIPLFIFMGAMFEQSGIAERLYEVMHIWTRRLPGGLAVGTVMMCVIFAAASGIIGATETVVGLLAIPSMLKYAYDKGLISGTICAGGSLGTIIPPSVVVVIMGPVADVSVGDLFIGMLIPGLLLALFYMIYIMIRCTIRPQDGPRVKPSADEPPLSAKLLLTLKALVPPAIIIVAVLGSIMAGIATPTEAAAVGALGAAVLTMMYGSFTLTVLRGTLLRTVRITAMILAITLGGAMFSGVFVATGGLIGTQNFLSSIEFGPWATLSVVMFITFIAGFVLEPISIILIIVPIAVPVLKAMGLDPVWFCVLFLVVIQTSYLTPPMAPSIFYLRGISPPEIRLHDMYRGIVPFIGVQILTLTLVMIFPALATWLPSVVLTGF